MINHRLYRLRQITQIITLYFTFCILLYSIYDFVYVFGKEEIDYTAQDLRDPFSSVIPEVAVEPETEKEPVEEETEKTEIPVSLPEFNIQAIVWDSPVLQAIINGKILGIGDTIEGAEITNITREGIDIIYKGRIFNLLSPGRKSLIEKKEGK